MKKLLTVVWVCLVHALYGQSPDAVQLNSFKQVEDNVVVSIKTTESFIVGANRYVLHIGGRYFQRSSHPDGRLDEILFYIPIQTYEELQDQGQVVLVYGFYHDNVQQGDGESEQTSGYMGKHWELGKFTAGKLD